MAHPKKQFTKSKTVRTNTLIALLAIGTSALLTAIPELAVYVPSIPTELVITVVTAINVYLRTITTTPIGR